MARFGNIHLSRRSLLLSAGAAGLAAPFAPALGVGTNARRMVVLLAEGGWDVTFAFDPKLGEPEIEGPERYEGSQGPQDVEVLTTYADIPVVTNEAKRANVSRFFENWADRTTVVNGIFTGSIAHDPSRYRILTGTPSNENADFASIVGSIHGAEMPLGSLDLSGRSLSGELAASAGRVGNRSQIAMLLDPSLSLFPPGAQPGTEPLFVADDSERALLDSFLDTRTDSLVAARGDAAVSGKINGLFEARDRARRLEAKGHVLNGHLNIGEVPKPDRMIDLMVELFQNDVCSTVTIDSGLTWDTHENNAPQNSNFNQLFKDIDAIVGGLDAAGLLESTLVLVVSEMTRTPKYNATGGKDHWPHTAALMVGGPVAGGRVCGGTDGTLESLPMDLGTGEVSDLGELCRFDNFVAGVLSMMDVDPEPWLPGVAPFLGALH